MQQWLSGIPQYLNDDGVTFSFKLGLDAGETTTFDGILGFFHRPIHASAFATLYGTVTPPVTWTEYDNLDSWVEILKYCARNHTSISVYYDDTIIVDYKSWSAVAKPPGGPARHAPPEQRYGEGWEMNWVYKLEF
ncbi:MAG TPA: hypothetical protein VE400_24960 [Mycobacterium sp.]|jgi:hypothetical protein|nr:hypothetical protein [Mycobacterium sp.]